MKRHYERNGYMLKNKLENYGYDWWWHNLVALNRDTGEEESLFIQYMIVNPALSPDKAILAQLPIYQEKGQLPSYALMRVGRWGLDKKHVLKFYPSNMFSADRDKMDVTIANNRATETHLKGDVLVSKEDAAKQSVYNADAGHITWDLTTEKQFSYSVGYGASSLFRRLNAFKMYWHVQGMKVNYKGTITIDDTIYDVRPDKSYGYQDKNWGQDYTNPWIWIGCNHFTSEKTGQLLDKTSLDVGGGAPVVFGKKLGGRLLIAFYHEGQLQEFNFAKFWTRSQEKFKYEENDQHITWKITAKKPKMKIVIHFQCRKDEMIRIDPEGVNGKRNHSDLHNGGTGYGSVTLYEKKENDWVKVDKFIGKHAGCELGK